MRESDLYYKLSEELIEKLSEMSVEDREEFFSLIGEAFCMKCGIEVDGSTCWECKDIEFD